MIKNNFFRMILFLFAATAASAQPVSRPPSGVAASTAAVRSHSSSKSSAEPRGTVEVLEMAFAAQISSMAPVGRGDSFDASVGMIYFWNRLKVDNPPARIRHAWYHDGAKAGEYDITLRHSNSRAWTHRRVSPGFWRVDILDDKGNPIATAAFPVRPPSPQ